MIIKVQIFFLQLLPIVTKQLFWIDTLIFILINNENLVFYNQTLEDYVKIYLYIFLIFFSGKWYLYVRRDFISRANFYQWTKMRVNLYAHFSKSNFFLEFWLSFG